MLIEVQGMSKRYRPRGPLVVEEISFAIDRGETLAIFGDSGSGKSTIGQILAGTDPATAGEIRLDGQRFVSSAPGACPETDSDSVSASGGGLQSQDFG